MALTVNSNLSSLIVNHNSSVNINELSTAIEKLTTGYKINTNSDKLTDFASNVTIQNHFSPFDVVSRSSSLGIGLLNTLTDSYNVVFENLSRIKELTESVNKGLFDDDALESVKEEINSRVAEINSYSESVEFNGVKLLNGSRKSVSIQLGVTNSIGDALTLNEDVFGETAVTATNLMGEEWSENQAGSFVLENPEAAKDRLNNALKDINMRLGSIESYHQKLETALKNLDSMDVGLNATSMQAEADKNETVIVIKSEIIKNAAVTLLTTANFTPDTAIQLL